jgi:shikimate dehydrogenase
MTAASIPRVCVMGHPIAHSRSPMIHGHWLATLGIAGTYELEDIAPEDFDEFLAHFQAHGYIGGNVTVPHKEAAYRLVGRRDPLAEAVGAVNTVWLEHGELVGGNSDPYGFISNLDDRAPGWEVAGCRAVILGAGGSARAATYALLQRGIVVALVNRTLARAQDLATKFGPKVTAHGVAALPVLLPAADLLVNCTSQGMVGQPRLALDLDALKPSAVVYDIVYVPLETELLAAARRRGHRTADGTGMLLQQAGFGFHKWFGVHPKVTPELRALIEADIVAKMPKV